MSVFRQFRFTVLLLVIAWMSMGAGAQDARQPLLRYPDSLAPVVGYIRAGTQVDLIARYVEGGWLYVAERDASTPNEGWLPMSALSLNQEITSLPELDLDTQDILYEMPYANFSADKLKPIFAYGQSLGNFVERFSKVGDSITVNKNFLTPLGAGVYDLGQYTFLQPAVDFFSATPQNPITSFDEPTVAAAVGWATRDLLKAADDYRCPRTLTQLECEYSITKPAAALIMIGTNDVPTVRVDAYTDNLRRIVEISIDRGVIPVLYTLPPQANQDSRVDQFNRAIIDVADAYDVPLVNYWLMLQTLPDRGLTRDGVHPSSPPADAGTTLFTPDKLQYGYTVRNLMSVHALYYLLTVVYS